MDKKVTVLVIQTDGESYDAICRAIERLGYEVRKSTPSQAVADFLSLSPDFTILAPCVTGEQREYLARTIKELQPAKTVFVLESRTSVEELEGLFRQTRRGPSDCNAT